MAADGTPHPEPPALPLTLPEWREAYRGGARPADLLPALLAQLERDSPREAWITRVTPAQLAARLAALDAGVAALQPAPADVDALHAALPLYGVPFAVKDNIDVAGLPTTAACPAWTHTAAQDASCVAKLLAAGAVCVGKTNLDQFATGLVGARSPYGRPSSALVPDRVSGGSSSGSAVVVARGDVPFALGTDTAGSGRVPAGFNNIVGLKPTPGRVSTAGVLPACRTLDCPSVFALTVEDALEVLAVMEGADAADAYSAPVVGPRGSAPVPRVGVPAAPIFGTEPGYRDAWDMALAQVRALGWEPVPIDFTPLHAVASLLYEGPWVAERHTVVQALMQREPEALDPIVKRIIEPATRWSATDLFRAQYRLKDLQQTAASVWYDVDLLLVPTAPAHPRHSEVDADPIGANAQLGTYTNFVNLLGWSALALPAGFTADGLPFGITLIGPGGHDVVLGSLGAGWQHALRLPLGATGRPMPEALPPLRRPASEPTLALAVVGAHLSGLPLNGQLLERGAALRETTATAAAYRLYALPGTVPPKPGLQRVAQGGHEIAVEVWEMPMSQVGSFLALIPPPLGLGSLELVDGRWVHGFVCEAHALAGARDISAHGGWRAYLAHLAAGGQ